eukprot:612324-Pleurochrysis_carterae.AAC.2
MARWGLGCATICTQSRSCSLGLRDCLLTSSIASLSAWPFSDLRLSRCARPSSPIRLRHRGTEARVEPVASTVPVSSTISG